MKKFLQIALLTGLAANVSSLKASLTLSTSPARAPLSDTEREQFFTRSFVPVLSHNDIETILSDSFKHLLRINETSTHLIQQSSEKGNALNSQAQMSLRTARENYKKYVLTKAKTIYPLPEAFLEGCLVSPKQILQCLKQVGVDPARVDKEKFWVYCMRCLEMPDARLDLVLEEDIITPYLAHLAQLKNRYINRIREDVFFLTTFTAPHLRANIFLPSLSSGTEISSSSLLSQSFLRQSGDSSLRAPEDLHIISLVASHRYSTTGLQPIIEAIQAIDRVPSLERICRGISADMRAKSWRSPDEIIMPVKVAEKLHHTPTADLRPEIIDLTDALLSRQFNKLVLEKIEENFEKARAPRARGFDSRLPDDIL